MIVDGSTEYAESASAVCKFSFPQIQMDLYRKNALRAYRDS